MTLIRLLPKYLSCHKLGRYIKETVILTKSYIVIKTNFNYVKPLISKLNYGVKVVCT